MHRYSPVRNQRSKGVKIKHLLRFCFLIAVCCWLIYQIKKSHYKIKDLEFFDTHTLSSVDDVIKLGRKDLTREEDDQEHEIEEEKDDEIDEIEQYKFDDEDDTVNESQSQSAREEHYKADDASSAVTHEHVIQVRNGVKIQETGYESANIDIDHDQNDFDSPRVVEESETSLKSTNMSAVVESETILTTKENNIGSLKTEVEIEEPDEVQHDAIDSTDFIGLEDADVL